MVVYIDVLVFLNAVVDYFILLAASFFAERKIKEWRLIVSSFLSALGSLYIFAPKTNMFFDFLFKGLFSLLITLCAFGYKKLRIFLKAYFCFFGVSLLYCGLAVLLWTVFAPNKMVIKNWVVYFNISLVQMLVFTVVGYVIIRIVRYFLIRSMPHSKRADLTLFNENTTVNLTALVDSGNSLKDVYQNRKIIITDNKTAETLFGNLENKLPLLLPYKTINGSSFAKAYGCKTVKVNNKTLDNVLVAVCDVDFNDDYKAIVSTDILEE